MAKEVSELEPEDLQPNYYLSSADRCNENSEAIDDIYDRYVAESDDISRKELEEMTFKAKNKDATIYR